MTTVEDLMTEKVITTTPDTPLMEAVSVLTKHSFNGLPVVDKEGKLVGLLTEHNMISNDSYVHLKTLIKLVTEIGFYKNDKTPIKEDLKKILALKVSDMMSMGPKTIKPNASVEEASHLFADPKNNPLPVVNDSGFLIGILSLSDLTKLYGVSLRDKFGSREIDQHIDNFMRQFEKEFVVVTKFRKNTWLVTSLIFAIIGFIIAFILIIRISV